MRNLAGLVMLKILVALAGFGAGLTGTLMAQNVHFEIGAAEIFKVMGFVFAGLATLGIKMLFQNRRETRDLRIALLGDGSEENVGTIGRMQQDLDKLPEIIRAKREEDREAVTGLILDHETRLRDLEQRGH